MQLDIYFEAYGESMKELFYPLGFRNIRVLCKSLEEITYQPERDIFFVIVGLHSPNPRSRPNSFPKTI